jgi:uncharacterized membrane protein YfcA
VFNPAIYPGEIAGTFVFTVMMALCQVAGIGGGGIDEPMNMAFYKFNTKESVALSSFIILICTIVRTIYTWRTKDPEKPHRIVTDYGLAVIMMPTSLAGSQIGAVVLHTCPAIVIQSLLFIVLVLLAIQAWRKAAQMTREENNQRLAK